MIVDFPNVKFEPGTEWDPAHPTWVPVPVVEVRCEKRCCAMKTIPLCVCEAMTIDKSQGLTVGEGELFTKAVVGIAPTKGGRNTPGLDQVGLTRTKEMENVAIVSSDPDQPLSLERLLKIGTSPVYQKRREFESFLHDRHEETVPHMKDRIAAVDPNQNEPSFDGGYAALVKWYRDIVDELGLDEAPEDGHSEGEGE